MKDNDFRSWKSQDDDLISLWKERDCFGDLISIAEISQRLRRTEGAVLTRARNTGLSYFNRSGAPKKEPPIRMKMKCLCCGEGFQSSNKKTNRICLSCKNSSPWSLGNDLTMTI